MRDEQLINKIFMSYNFSLGFDAPIYLWKQACKYVTAESDIYSQNFDRLMRSVF